MSPTIRKPRARPRVDSFRYGTLWWLARREASLRIAFPDVIETGVEPRLRADIASYDTRRLARSIAHILILAPDRRYWYPSAYVEMFATAEQIRGLRCIDADCIITGPHVYHPRTATTEPPRDAPAGDALPF